MAKTKNNITTKKRVYTPRKRLYDRWYRAKQRCLDPNHPEFKNYGARGISMCKRWMKFSHFEEDMGYPPDGFVLDRVNNNRGYMPSNCEWVTPRRSARNRRTNIRVRYKGETLTLVEWSERLNISADVLYDRYKNNPSSEYIFRPVKKRGN